MSEEKTVQKPTRWNPPFAVQLAGKLLGICAAAALLLGTVNLITAPRISAMQQARREAAMGRVLPADEYIPVEGELPEHISAWYTARSGGTGVGWVVEAAVSGSQGPITMMVGVTAEGAVSGVSVVEHRETPNLGTKVADSQTVLDRFIGMSREAGEITVNSGPNRVDGVSGATVTSQAVASGVNAALEAVAWKLLEANFQPDAG